MPEKQNEHSASDRLVTEMNKINALMDLFASAAIHDDGAKFSLSGTIGMREILDTVSNELNDISWEVDAMERKLGVRDDAREES
ncbi:hypothetical protein DESC_810082 [Desulfosarcina cetonica]|uniref:hypothetical protein n=1 Tax=Desulfosarcina cetonica TaxID=90730 RepID=UPI0006D28E33|nr:hypothetical protein [Desulfosarcina cetonica]VTR70511.1 hypothetical protein DESC_810082 [Desulfosarcina cetonica]